ncbi:MAG: 50S ribosomal protein L10 [Candidatus Roizmanbacteria bacterium]|nr:50S ribosomal protein L10 [Candidatus Roizmanbacteria bacterium]
MPNKQKQDVVSNLVTALQERASVVLVDYKGLTHHQLEELRIKVTEAGGLLRIVKNNLFLIALKHAQFPTPDEALTGPTAVLFVPTTDPSPIKIIYDQGKALESLEIKWGIWENQLIDKSKVEQLATLPSREELLAKVVGSLKSPQTRLVLSLKSNLQKLVMALEEIRKQKEAVIAN